MPINKLGAAALLCGLASTGQAATDFQYYVFPVKGITGISLPASANTAFEGPKYGAMIDAKYTDLFFNQATQDWLATQFQAQVANRFPTSVIGANQVMSKGIVGKYVYSPSSQSQCSPPFKVGLKSAYAVAFGMSRVSAYVNDYAGFTQILVPVTYTIRFVKLNGASIVFSKSETIYTRMESTAQAFYGPGTKDLSSTTATTLREAVSRDALTVMARLVDDAAKSFVPKQTRVGVVSRDDGYFVFDRGSEIGFASNEDFDATDQDGNEYSFTVKYATDKLAIAQASEFSPEVKAATNRLRAGAQLEFSFSKPGKDDAKPTVLALQLVPPRSKSLSGEQVVANSLQSMMVDDIGFSAPFNLVKEDPDFARLKSQIRGEANCDSTMFNELPGFSDNSTRRQSDPDFFLKLTQVTSPEYTARGARGVDERTDFKSAVQISLLDKAGVVRQSVLAVSDYELRSTAGKGLSLAQAREVNLKNASSRALARLLAEFSPKRTVFTAAKVGGGSVQFAEAIPPEQAANLRLARPVKVSKATVVHMPLSRSDVRLVRPVGEDGTTFQLQGTGLKPGDVAILTSSAAPGVRLVEPCEPSRKRYFLDASLEHRSGVESMVANQVLSESKSYAAVESDPSVLHSMASALHNGFYESGASDTPIAPPQATSCMLAMEMQKLAKKQCERGLCEGTGSVAGGIRIFEGSVKRAEAVVGADFNYSEVDETALTKFFGIKSFELVSGSVKDLKSKLQ